MNEDGREREPRRKPRIAEVTLADEEPEIVLDAPAPLVDHTPEPDTDPAPPWKRFLRGPGGIVASSLAFAAMNFMVKLASAKFPASQITSGRFLFGVIVLGALGWAGRLDIRPRNHRLLVSRGILGSFAIVLLFLAISKTRLTNAILLANTYVLFGALFAVFFLGEGFGASVGIALLAAMIGAGFVVRPNFHTLHTGDLLALSHGVVGGGAITVVRSLRRAGHESPWAILFYLSLIGVPAGIIAGLLVEHRPWPVPHGTGLVLLLFIGLFGTVGQGLLTYAYRWCTTAEGGILSLLVVPITAVLGMTFLGERFSGWDWIGAGLIMLSSVYVLLPKSE